MRPIPEKLKKEMAADPYYSVCARSGLHGHTCDGSITWEHVLIYSGRQLNERWAIIPLCEKAHSVNNYQDGGDLNKEINVWIALNRASEEDLASISKVIDYKRKRNILNQKYGRYTVPLLPYGLPANQYPQ